MAQETCPPSCGLLGIPPASTRVRAPQTGARDQPSAAAQAARGGSGVDYLDVRISALRLKGIDPCVEPTGDDALQTASEDAPDAGDEQVERGGARELAEACGKQDHGHSKERAGNGQRRRGDATAASEAG